MKDVKTDAESQINLTTKLDIRFLLALAPIFIAVVGIYFKLEVIQREIQRSWTVSDQLIFAAQLSKSNPTMTVPDANDIHRATQ